MGTPTGAAAEFACWICHGDESRTGSVNLFNSPSQSLARITREFGVYLLHDDQDEANQTLRIAMTQMLDESPTDDSLTAYHAAIDEARERGFEVDSTTSDSTTDESAIKTNLSIPLTVEHPIAPEVASQWNTILASGSTDSALANSQQSMGQLARSLPKQRTRR